jgi:hypothetical protein
MAFSLSDAVYKLNPTAEFVITGDTLEGLQFIKPKTAKIPTQSEIDQALADLEADALAQAEAKSAAKASAIAKLSGLGLTSDEVLALLG